MNLLVGLLTIWIINLLALTPGISLVPTAGVGTHDGMQWLINLGRKTAGEGETESSISILTFIPIQ